MSEHSTSPRRLKKAIGEGMGTLLNILMLISVLIGLFFNTMGVLGILRFPDVYTRLHADTKATTFGSIFTSLAVVIWALRSLAETGDGQYVNLAVHTVFAVVVLALTNATGAHAIARAAYHMGCKPANMVVDRLARPATDEPAAPKEGA